MGHVSIRQQDKLLRECMKSLLVLMRLLVQLDIEHRGLKITHDVFLQMLILVFATMNLISTTIGWCPVYQLANINTHKKD